jgi:hypothetical protein
MRTAKPIVAINVPKAPRTGTFDELSSACRIASLDAPAITLAEQGNKPWILAALTADNIKSVGRNRATAAVHAVYGAQLEILRLKALQDRLRKKLLLLEQEALEELSGFKREDRRRLAPILYELGKCQRDAIRRRREVLQYAEQRDERLGIKHRPLGAEVLH